MIRISEKILALEQMLKTARIYCPSSIPSILKELEEETLRVVKRDALRVKKRILKQKKGNAETL
jgi:hypothetical protein